MSASNSTEVSPSPTPSISAMHNAPKFGTLVPNRVFVGGISANTTEEELYQLFSTYGHVKATKIIADRAGVSKGYGFVTFETEEEAKQLQREADNIVFKDRKLNIAPAIKKQAVPNGTVMYHNGVPYTYQNGLAVFTTPETYSYHQPPHAYPVNMIYPQPVYLPQQQFHYPPTSPQPQCYANGQWRWPQPFNYSAQTSSPQYVYPTSVQPGIPGTPTTNPMPNPGTPSPATSAPVTMTMVAPAPLPAQEFYHQYATLPPNLGHGQTVGNSVSGPGPTYPIAYQVADPCDMTNIDGTGIENNLGFISHRVNQGEREGDGRNTLVNKMNGDVGSRTVHPSCEGGPGTMTGPVVGAVPGLGPPPNTVLSSSSSKAYNMKINLPTDSQMKDKSRAGGSRQGDGSQWRYGSPRKNLPQMNPQGSRIQQSRSKYVTKTVNGVQILAADKCDDSIGGAGDAPSPQLSSFTAAVSTLTPTSTTDTPVHDASCNLQALTL